MVFGVFPLLFGLLIGRRIPAVAVWVAAAGSLAWSQRSDDELGKFWVVMALIAVVVSPLVPLGVALRARVRRRRRRRLAERGRARAG